MLTKKKIGQLRADNPPGSKFGVILPGPGYVNKNCPSNMISDSDEDDVCVTEKYIKDNDTLKKYGWAGNKQLYYVICSI